ncbi:MAG: hypothetical protein R3274_12885 [Desulfobacterales bacterium]|nr:hypothetical protein [Desulfobacterales bacterium]
MKPLLKTHATIGVINHENYLYYFQHITDRDRSIWLSKIKPKTTQAGREESPYEDRI